MDCAKGLNDLLNRAPLISGTVFAAFSCQMIRRALAEWAVYAATDDDWNRIAQVAQVLGVGVVVAVTVNCT